MPQYIYTKRIQEIFSEFSQEIDPDKKKRKRSDVSINSNYKHRVMLFFKQYMSKDENYQREIKDICSEDLNNFMNDLDSDMQNYYLTLTSFFKFTYEKKYTDDIVIGVKAPVRNAKEYQFISQAHCKKIVQFINDESNKINNRLLLGLFYYTGLKLNAIMNLTESSFTESYSIMWVNNHHIPVRKELQILLMENKKCLIEEFKLVNPEIKIINISENSVSTKVAKLSKDITDKKYSPICYEKTFKKRALEINCNPYYISELTLSSIASVAKYIDESISFEQQKKIIESMK